MLTITGEEATFTVAGRVVVPGVTATVLTMVVPAGTLSTVGAEEGGIFWVAAAAAANAAIPLICGLLPITCGGHTVHEPVATLTPRLPSSLFHRSHQNPPRGLVLTKEPSSCPALLKVVSLSFSDCRGLLSGPRPGLLPPTGLYNPVAGVCQQLQIFPKDHEVRYSSLFAGLG